MNIVYNCEYLCNILWCSGSLHCTCVRHDMGMGNTMIMWSQVCSGMGTGWTLPYLGNTIPVPVVLWVYRYQDC